MTIASQFRTRGKTIVAYGRNYADHIKELNNTTPTEPFFFLKPASSYTTGDLELPQGVVVHHEGEARWTRHWQGGPRRELAWGSSGPGTRRKLIRD